ncbi:MAG: hypothetical protein ACW96M_08375 [Candidatus Thorarchaeota archaeon]
MADLGMKHRTFDGKTGSDSVKFSKVCLAIFVIFIIIMIFIIFGGF